MDLKEMHSSAQEFTRLLKLRTYPLAIKMLKREQDIPEQAERPVRDMGYHLDLCQGFAMSRWEGRTIAMLKEDMWCFEPVVGYGLAEPAKEFLEGHNRYPSSAMTLEAGKNWAQNFPRFKVGEYVGIVSAPLEKCSFEPDLFVVYGDPSQLTHMLIAKNAIDGSDVTCTLSGHAACVYAVVPLFRGKECLVASPCRGDRRIAMTQDNEITFSARIELLEDFVTAFRYLEKHDWGFPWRFFLHPERELLYRYKELGEKMGMKYDSKTQ